MDGMLRRCLLMSIGALALAGGLLAAGLPGAVLLGLAPVAVCLGTHLLIGHGDANGERLLATALRAGVTRDAGTDLPGFLRAVR